MQHLGAADHPGVDEPERAAGQALDLYRRDPVFDAQMQELVGRPPIARREAGFAATLDGITAGLRAQGQIVRPAVEQHAELGPGGAALAVGQTTLGERGGDENDTVGRGEFGRRGEAVGNSCAMKSVDSAPSTKRRRSAMAARKAMLWRSPAT